MTEIQVKRHLRTSKNGKLFGVRSYSRSSQIAKPKRNSHYSNKEFVNVSKMKKLEAHDFNFEGRKYRFEVFTDGEDKWIWKPFLYNFDRAPKSTNKLISEVVGSEVGRKLGLNVVENHFAVRIVKNKKHYGIISKFVPDSKSLKEVFLTDKKIPNDIFMFVPFEAWMKAVDRHLSQYVIVDDKHKKEAYALDFERSFEQPRQIYQVGHLAIVMGKGVEPFDKHEVDQVIKHIKSMPMKVIKQTVVVPEDSKYLTKEDKTLFKKRQKYLEEFLEHHKSGVSQDVNEFEKVRKEFAEKDETKRELITDFRKDHFHFKSDYRRRKSKDAKYKCKKCKAEFKKAEKYAEHLTECTGIYHLVNKEGKIVKRTTFKKIIEHEKHDRTKHE